MLVYDNIFALSQHLDTTRLTVLTTPLLATALYHLLVLCGITTPRFFKDRVAMLPFLAGLLLCGVACATVYIAANRFIGGLAMVTTTYTAIVFTLTNPGCMRIADRGLAFTKQCGVLLARFPVTFTASFIALLILPSLFYGFDVTDGGYHLSQGVVVFHEGLAQAHRSNYLFLTGYFSGAVTSLVQHLGFGLMGLRLVWMGFFIIPFVVTIHLMRKLFGTHWLLPFIGLAAAASCSIYTTVLEYEKVPAFFAAIFLYLLYRTYEGRTAIFRPSYATATGIAFFLLLLARVTSLPMLLVFLGPAIYAIQHTAIRKNLIVQIFGLILGACLFLSMLYYTGNLVEFFHYRNPTDIHSVGGIISIICTQIYSYVGQQTMGILLVLPFVLALAVSTRNTFLYALLLAILIYFAAPLLYAYHPLMGRTFPIVFCTALTLYVYAIHKPHQQLANPFIFPLILLAALLLPGAQGGGSDAGLIRFASGGWLLLPLSIMLLLSAANAQKTDHGRWNLYILTMCITLMLIAAGFQAFHRYPYGDNIDRRTMTGTFTHPQLAGIHTTPGRVESFEGLINAIEAHLPKGTDRLLVYNNLPMAFYASHTYPLFHHTWITCLSIARITEIAEDVCTTPETTPGLIVRTKVEVRNGLWGNYPQNLPIEEDVLMAKSKLNILDKGIKKCHATLVWQNEDFQLLRPKSTASGH